MIIDSHIHLYPPEVFNDPSAWATARGENYWLSCVAPPKGRSLQRWKTVDELVADMDAAGVNKAVVLSWYWENHHSCIENQKWLIEWTQAFPDRLLAFAPFNARGGSAALKLLEKALNMGFRGIGELNPPAQGYFYDDEILHTALELVGEREGFANFHVTDPRSHDYPGKIETPYKSLHELAQAHEKTGFIFAHLAGFYPVHEPYQQLPNVYYDLAAFPLLYSNEAYRIFNDKVGTDRILFGTDYPLKTFPTKKGTPNFMLPIEHLQKSSLDPDSIDQILGQNAARILNLK